MIIKIQPTAYVNRLLPHPYYINMDGGMVERQDFWNGKPLRLIGFSDRLSKDVYYSITFEQFKQDYDLCIERYPIFIDNKDNIYNGLQPITDFKIFSK